MAQQSFCDEEAISTLAHRLAPEPWVDAARRSLCLDALIHRGVVETTLDSPRLQQTARLLAIGIFLLGATARAEQPTTADVESLIKKGNDLRRQGKDQLALGYFQRAYDTSPTGRTSAQLGLCEKALGYLVPAYDHLDQALTSHGDAWVDKHKDVLEQNFREVKGLVVEVLVSGTPSGADVLVDGKVVGKIPLSGPVRFVKGDHRKVTLRAPGYLEGSEEIAGRGGEQVRVVLHLAQTPLAPTLTPPQQDPGTKLKDSGDAHLVQAEAANDNRPSSALRVAAWSTGAAAVLMGAVGAVEMVIASHKGDEFHSTPAPGMNRSCGTDLRDYGGGECITLREEWSRARTIGLIGLIGGGVLAGTSATLFVISAHGDDNQKVACAPAFPDIGLSCGGRF